MMPLRAAMPSTVTNPTSDPSDSTPPVSDTPTTPPTSANGIVRATSSVGRHDRKSAYSTSTMPISASPARAYSFRADSCRAAYSPRNSGWYSRSNCTSLTFSSTSRATAPRSRPFTLQVMSSRREAFSRLISFGAGTTITSATSPSRTCTPAGVSIGRSRTAVKSVAAPRARPTPPRRTSSAPSNTSPTFKPFSSVEDARRTWPGVRPYRSAASGRSRTSICGDSSPAPRP